jgi:hypothetical protein
LEVINEATNSMRSVWRTQDADGDGQSGGRMSKQISILTLLGTIVFAQTPTNWHQYHYTQSVIDWHGLTLDKFEHMSPSQTMAAVSVGLISTTFVAAIVTGVAVKDPVKQQQYLVPIGVAGMAGLGLFFAAHVVGVLTKK